MGCEPVQQVGEPVVELLLGVVLGQAVGELRDQRVVLLLDRPGGLLSPAAGA